MKKRGACFGDMLGQALQIRLTVIGISFVTMIFLIVVLGLTPVEKRHGYSALLVIPLACMLMVGAISLLFDRPHSHLVAERRAAIVDKKSCDCIWASNVFEELEFGIVDSHSLRFRSFHVKTGTDGAEWQQTGPAPVKSDACLFKPTCACCLDDFQPRSQVAILPCGHVFHEDCIARWSLATSKSANSCPTCRTSFECLADP